MTIGKLKKRIKDLPDDLEVILQKDSEGNGYENASGVDSDCIVVGDGWDIQVYDTTWSYSDAGFDDEEDWEEFKKEGKRVALIFP